MAELLQVIVGIISYLWPFRVVEQWSRGVYYVCGHYWRTMGPGLKVVVPFFTDVREVSVVPAIHGTPLQTVTMRNGNQLTFSATVTVQVEDAAKALNEVDQWHETVIEMVAGTLAERLAEIEPDRMEPERKKRQRLVEELRSELDKSASKWGVRVLALRFNNLATGVRTHRLLVERATMRDSL